ncbi:MAG: response regulator [Planococcaceae bacterium]|nr:response regulator [Bacillota bacterium]MDX1770685.1 response regulator [Planococcaceae bacterium]
MNSLLPQNLKKYDFLKHEKLILLIDQDMDFALKIKDLFHNFPYSILIATTAAKGLELFQMTNPDFIMIDPALPDKSGFILLEEISDTSRTRMIPISVVSNENSNDYISRSYQLGALDFIHKSINLETFIPFIENRCSIKSSLSSKVLIDDLTGAYTRKHFYMTVSTLSTQYRISNESFAIGLIDLDSFKEFNTQNGSQKGDEALTTFVEISKMITEVSPEVFRFNSDDFVVLFRHKSTEETKELIEQIADAMHSQFSITFSAGVTSWDSTTDGHKELLQLADYALQRAKKSGGNQIQIFDPVSFSKPISKNLTVHIIDDDEIVRAMLERQFSTWQSDLFNIHICNYENGFVFTESNWYNPQDYHVLLLDGVMPKMDGLEVLHKVKNNVHSQRVLVTMLTARKNEQDILHALNSGADDYMLKPFHPQEVLVRIQRLVNRLFI